MNKFKYIILSILLLSTTPIFSLLPPLFEDIAEIKAILDDKRLDEFLQSGESINEIKRTEKGYMIITTHHKLFAEVVYRPNSMPGPAQFDIVFIKVEPFKS